MLARAARSGRRLSRAEEHTLVHTHASESRDEVEVVRRLSGGYSNLEYLADTGLATSQLCAAHCVWVTEREQAILAERDVKVLHCPGSNLKLGSGIAPVVEMRARGISVSLGADGAACNNRLDMFDEIRLAATLQAMRSAPGALTARDAIWMATREGARALGLEGEIGSIEPGKRADLIIVDRDRPHLAPDRDPWSTLAYAARGTDVRLTMVDGEVLVDRFALTQLEPPRLRARLVPLPPSWPPAPGSNLPGGQTPDVPPLGSDPGRSAAGVRPRTIGYVLPGRDPEQARSSASRPARPCIMVLSTRVDRLLRNHDAPS